VAQFHFEPDSYLDMIRAEVPAYDELQGAVAARAAEIAPVSRVLDLGAGTGVTASAVLAHHPGASLTLVDESAEMLEHAQRTLPADRLEQVLVRDLAAPLPAGPFDLVVSALAVHHLDQPGKRLLFERVHEALRAGGRFVVGDVVIPVDPADAVTPLTPDYDRPDRIHDLLVWLTDAGFIPSVSWECKDLVVIAADVGRRSGFGVS
jgi:tRNA (cmo5U34)-methyltransferase